MLLANASLPMQYAYIYIYRGQLICPKLIISTAELNKGRLKM